MLDGGISITIDEMDVLRADPVLAREVHPRLAEGTYRDAGRLLEVRPKTR